MAQTKSRIKRLFLEALEDRCLLSTPDPAISFVATVAATRTTPTTYNLTVMNGDGSNQAVIWSRSGGLNMQIQKSSWSPQAGTTSPFTGSLVVGALNGGVSSLPGSSIFRIDLTVTSTGVVQASTPTRLVSNYSYQPSWSPTGNYIAFTGNNITASGQTETQSGIYLVPATGGTPTLVVANANPTGDVAAYPTWSPDGTSIAYEWRPSGSSSDSLLVKQVIDPTTGLPITNGPVTTVVPASAGFAHIQHLDWSKSTQTNRIAFELYSNSYPNGVIYTVDASGAGSPQILSSTANGGGPAQPTWSPDDPTTTSVNETDQYLLYTQNVQLTGKTYGYEIQRQQLATGNVVTVVGPGPSGTVYGWTDWRRAADAGWAPSSSIIATNLLTQAAPLQASATLGHSIAPSPAPSGGAPFEFTIATADVSGKGNVHQASLTGSAKGAAAPAVVTPIATSWQSDFTGSVPAAPILIPMATAPHTLEDLTRFWEDFSTRFWEDFSENLLVNMAVL